MSDAVDWDDDAQTELCHDDDGFVYRRKRRRRSEDELYVPASSRVDPERDRTNWRRKKLLRLRDGYQKEIRQWEFLSNSLRAMEDQVGEENVEVASDTEKAQSVESAPESATVIDELLLKVEAQESIISHVSNLCDVAESVCSDLEEQLNKFFMDLSVWSSPRKLMSFLSN